MSKTKYVYVTYDPLFERVICVHEKGNKECSVCKKRKYKERDSHHLEEYKLKIRTKLTDLS
jgi:hypothetical protein